MDSNPARDILLDGGQTLSDETGKGRAASWWRVISLLIGIVVFAICAIVGVYAFFESPSISGVKDENKPAGYGPWEIIGLAAWFYLAPSVVVLSFALTMHLLKMNAVAPAIKVSWVLAAVLLCATSAVLAAVLLAQDALSCGVIFCFDISSPGSTKVGAALFNSVGLGLLVISVGLCAAFIAVSVRNFFVQDDTRRKIPSLQDRLRRRRLRRASAAVILAVVVLPFCLFLTAILPNTFQAFQSKTLSTFMAMEKVFGTTTAAEEPGAWMKTVNWKWSDSVVLKLYPDTLLYYGFLEVLAVAAILSAAFPAVGKFFAKPVKRGVTVGECMSIALLSLLMVSFIFYWLHDHRYHGGGSWDKVWSERIARTCGMTAVLFMSLCLLPASKNSLWLQALGVSWESSVWLHRWLGGLSIIWAIAHVVSFWVRFAQWGVFPHDILAIPPFYPIDTPEVPAIANGDNWTMPLMQLIAYPAFFMIGLPHFWRKKNWEIFKYFHFIFLALIPATLLHAASSWYYFLGGIAFYLVDAALRFIGAASPCKLHYAKAHAAEGGITEVGFDKKFLEPGQYCFINVPAISAWEWHPFSLCSSPLDATAQMCIKNMGKDTFTGRLWEFTKSYSEATVPFVINVDGPYGPPLDPSSHAAMMLVAGGIGITPIHSTFRMLSQLASRGQLPGTLKIVRLVWIGRSRDLFSILSDSVVECLKSLRPDGAPTFHATFYIDCPDSTVDKDSSNPTDLGVPTVVGRPNLSELMDALLAECDAGTALVQCCGPPPMANAAEKIAEGKPGIVYQSELFAL